MKKEMTKSEFDELVASIEGGTLIEYQDDITDLETAIAMLESESKQDRYNTQLDYISDMVSELEVLLMDADIEDAVEIQQLTAKIGRRIEKLQSKLDM